VVSCIGIPEQSEANQSKDFEEKKELLLEVSQSATHIGVTTHHPRSRIAR